MSEQTQRTGEDSSSNGEAPTQPEAPQVRARGSLKLAPGNTLGGRYTILERLGQGGMGVVLAAYDARLDRRVALKLVRSHEGSDTSGTRLLEARLVREAQAMARLNHPHVVALYDALLLEDGSVGLAMEYVEGQTLRQWCTHSPRPWRQVLQAYLDAGRGLAAAHAAGLIHRDFKPENVLVGRDGRVRVTDFGLAQAHHAPPLPRPSPAALPADTWETPLTLTGTLLGTPAYMAPEVFHGEPAGVRSDVYAFCAALYEALYGQLPYPASTPQALLRAWQAGQVPLPPHSEVPAWVGRTVLRGLQVEPGARPASLQELLAALEDDPVARRRTWLLRAALASGVAVLAAVAAWGWASRPEPVAPCSHMEARLAGAWDSAVKERVRQALLGTGAPYARDTLVRVEAALDGYARAWVEQRTQVCQAQGSEGAAQGQRLTVLREACLEQRLGRLRTLTEVLGRGADAELLPQAVQAARSLPPLEYCADARALTAAVPPPEDPAVRAQVEALQAQVDRVETLLDAGKYPEGLAQALRLRPQVETTGYAPLLARLLSLLSMLQDYTGDAASAEQSLRQAALVGARGGDRGRVAEAWSRLAFLLAVRLGRSQEAQLLEPVAEVSAELAQDEWTLAFTLHHLGGMALALQRYDEAKQRLERALALRQKLLGPEHPRSIYSLHDLTSVLAEQGRYEEARHSYERVLALMEKTLGPEHPQYIGTLSNLGELLARMGHHAEARQTLERAQALQDKVLGPKHPTSNALLYTLGKVLHQQQLYAEAWPKLERALAVAKGDRLAALQFELARHVWSAPQDRPRALRLARQARDHWQKTGHAVRLEEVSKWLASPSSP